MGDFRAQIAAVQDRRAALPRNDRANTAATPCSAASRRSWIRARRWRASACATSPTASTRRNRSWTTTASTSASACRSGCGSRSTGDRMTVDLTDVSKQVAGFYNSGETAGRSCCQVAFKCLTSALDLPINDGQFRALDIVLPPGRVVSAREARRDADVDDLSDDHRRHDLQGAGAGAARPGHRRPSRRSRASAASTAAGRRTTASTSISAA